MDIYIHKNGADLGPFTPERVKEGLTHGDFSRSDHAWREGLADWLPLGDVIQSTASPAPPSSASEASSPTSKGPSHIFVVRGQTVLGPFTATEVNDQLKTGVFTAADVAKHSGSETLWPLLAVPGVVLSPSSTAQIPAPERVSIGTQTFAGFWVRFAAYVVDVLVMYVPYLIIHSPLKEAVSRVRGDDDVAGQLHVVLTSLTTSLVGICAWWLYSAFAESSAWQGTVGKKLLGLRVTSLAGGRISFGQATGRYFSKCVSALILGIGFVMAAFTERKQALHDFMAGTLVLKSSALTSQETSKSLDAPPASQSKAGNSFTVPTSLVYPQRELVGQNRKTFVTTPAERPQNGATSANLVLAIIVVGLLIAGAFVIMKMSENKSGTSASDQQARITAALKQISSFELALDQFEIDNGFYPASGDLIALVEKPADAPNWKGPYFTSVPLDPWGNTYKYRYPGKHNTSSYDLASNGPDGRNGTTDDIANWNSRVSPPASAHTAARATQSPRPQSDLATVAPVTATPSGPSAPERPLPFPVPPGLTDFDRQNATAIDDGGVTDTVISICDVYGLTEDHRGTKPEIRRSEQTGWQITVSVRNIRDDEKQAGTLGIVALLIAHEFSKQVANSNVECILYRPVDQEGNEPLVAAVSSDFQPAYERWKVNTDAFRGLSRQGWMVAQHINKRPPAETTIAPSDSSMPLLRFFLPEATGSGAPSITYDDEHPLLAINNFTEAHLEKKGVSITMNTRDMISFATLTRKYKNDYLVVVGSKAGAIEVMHILGEFTDGHLALTNSADATLAEDLRDRLHLGRRHSSGIGKADESVTHSETQF